MLYHIEGEDRVTNVARTMEVTADSAAEASAQATAAGMVVTRISKAPGYAGHSTQSGSRRSPAALKPPAYELLRQSAMVITTLGVLVAILGIIVACVGAFEKLTSDKVLLADSKLLMGLSELTGGVIMVGLGQGLIAVRDIAIHSFPTRNATEELVTQE